MRSRVGARMRALATAALLASCAWAQGATSGKSATGSSETTIPQGTSFLGQLQPGYAPGITVIASPLGADAQTFPVAGRAESNAKGEFDLALPDGWYSFSVLVRGTDAKTTAALLPRHLAAHNWISPRVALDPAPADLPFAGTVLHPDGKPRSEEHTSELQSL